MHISRLRILDYKGFKDSGEILLSPGFNVIIGANSAGKTALLEAASLSFHDNPHLRPRAKPTEEPTSIVKSTLQASHEEFLFAVAENGPELHVPLGNPRNAPQEVEEFEGAFRALGDITLVAINSGSGVQSAVIDGVDTPPFKFKGKLRVHSLLFNIDPESGELSFVSTAMVEPWRTFPLTVARALQKRIYMLDSMRPIDWASRRDIAYKSEYLHSSATNLARRLSILASEDPKSWNRFRQAVSTVLPEVREVITREFGKRQVGIWVSPSGQPQGATEYRFPLNQVGSGVAQVMAILYVAITSDRPQVLLLEEPQNFLHPGAVQRLFDVLRAEAAAQHQYVISTHSPTVVNAASPTTLLSVTRSGLESSVHEVALSERAQVQRCLELVGARLSDVFGMDLVLWCEGETEATCFPEIISHFNIPVPPGFTILGVVSTGDFDSRRRELVLEIYGRLTGMSALLPQAVVFVLDDEGRHESELKKLTDKGKGRVHFLPRRMFENYLLNPAGIAQVISDMLSESLQSGKKVSAEQVTEWLASHGSDVRYISGSFAGSEEQWKRKVDSARLLQDLVSDLTDRTLNYRDYKIEFGRRLTAWGIENSHDDLEELARFLANAIGNGISSAAIVST